MVEDEEGEGDAEGSTGSGGGDGAEPASLNRLTRLPSYFEGVPVQAELRRELMHVHFINSLRNRNPGAMHVGVPTVDKDGSATVFRPAVEGKDGLEDRLKASTPGVAPPQMEVFKNREPKWNAESQMYQLDFRGRATHASCKNIQLTRKDGDQSQAELLMGKVEENKFNIDFQYPFSALQAFAFALVIFDNSSSSMTL